MSITKIFYRGRIGRQTYLLANISLIIFAVVAFVIIEIVFPKIKEFTSIGVIYSPNPAAQSFQICVILFVCFFNIFILNTKRFHDLGKSGLIQVCAILPLINLVYGVWAFFVLCFKPGISGPNEYGENPIGFNDRIKSWENIMATRNKVEYQQAHYLFVENEKTQDEKAWITFLSQAREELIAKETALVASKIKLEQDNAEQHLNEQKNMAAKDAADKKAAEQLKNTLRSLKHLR